MTSKIFIHKKLPFVELRYVDRVTSCDKKHLHDQLTLTAIREGAMNIVYNDHIDELLPNTLSVVNPHVVHCAILNQYETIGCYVLYLNEQWCMKLQ